MKPAPFDYRAPDSVDEAIALLGEHGGRASVLAGGQSLLIELRYRQHRPDLLVDINRIPGMAGTGIEDGRLHIGALVRHADLERAAFDDPLATLLHETARHVAHPPIRARGTFAGSLAWAHPAAEWNALAVALEVEIVLRGAGGERRVPAGSWFRGPHRTARETGELVTEVRIPLLGAGTAVRFAELRRTHGSFPLVAVVVAVRLAGTVVDRVRIGLANAAPVPLRAVDAERMLAGAEPSPELLRAAAERAAEAAEPVPEPYCSVDYRRHATAVLVRRCLAAAVEEARGWT